MRTRQARIGYSLLVLVMTALLVATGIAVGAVAGTVAAAPSEISGGGWPTAGYDIADIRDAVAEHDIGPGNVSRLATAWSLTTTGSVTVTPTEADGTVYFPDSGGTLYWGSGYLLPISCPAPALALTYCPVGNDKFYAFALPAPRR